MKTLEELKNEDLPRCEFSRILKGETTKENKACIQEYLNEFVTPTIDRKCISCGSDLVGFLGTFRWGIEYGEGFCRECGYPARAIHCIENKDNETILKTNFFVMQYHPNTLELQE
jgi:predicted amidophosphoribosyltransferase